VRLFALDQNFPQPIVDGLRDWLEPQVELVPIARIGNRLATSDDWEILLTLHNDERPWDGLITTEDMTALPRELAVLCQTKLTLVIAAGAGHDPVMATGLVLAHISNICNRTRDDRPQIWSLRTVGREADDPWEHIRKLANRRGVSASALYGEHKLTPEQLASSPLDG
jgi:hypothetical protein